MRSDPAQAFASREDLLNYIKDLIFNKINPQLSKVLPEKYITDDLLNIEVEAVPQGGAGIAYYLGKPAFGDNIDDETVGTYYINLNQLDNFKKFELLALTLHEASPGHHLHFTLAGDADTPSFLRGMLLPPMGEVPSSPPQYTAFKEGWALYAEHLGIELGLYDDDPTDMLGYYSFNLLRASRLVVDTGMHAFGWSRQKAIDYLLDNTALGEYNVEGEIDRYTYVQMVPVGMNT